ncbi:MAG TPA: FAD-dependent oxidoreductase [Vitreimonas sp.]|uniref:FAD-dependent oxidoreductase n=1 Tax=Vitreimonas sp. TaxID=3069702 RepID=UPI002D71ABD9|nr:FAD-dependent oxidoreductase [Vitreimonas sp.]HYD87328.1 FAD-dependent oxidoreductase [Vitreimonas sp.]
MPLTSLSALDSEFDAIVVGAGPAGLACAFDLHDHGLKVALLEAGGARPIPGEPDIRAAEIAHPEFHDPVDIVAASALGGSTHWWGGRSIPFDPVDFRHWPINYDDMLPWWEKAAAFLGSKSVSESAPPPAFQKLQRFDALRDECWGPELNMGRRWRARIAAADGPAIVTNARVTGLDYASGRIAAVRVGEKRVRAKQIVLTSGGLGTLKLLLLLQREHPHLFSDALGRCYMGHLTGAIAAIAPSDPADVAAFTTRPIGDNIYARRRLRPTPQTVTDENIVNIAFWFENGAAANPAHGDATASARYLATRMLRLGRGEGALGPHLANVARAPWSAAAGLTSAAYLLTAARLTGRHPRQTKLTPAAANAWRLDYHAEQPPHADNRISLGESLDSAGLPKLRIDFRMRDAEIDSVVRAHELLDADLQQAHAGKLLFAGDRDQSVASVRAAARDGYHQLGGAVMSTNAAAGVVDTDLRVHTIENLHVASGSVFPSGGQANPTLTIVALARRLADTLARGQSAAQRIAAPVNAD